MTGHLRTRCLGDTDSASFLQFLPAWISLFLLVELSLYTWPSLCSNLSVPCQNKQFGRSVELSKFFLQSQKKPHYNLSVNAER